MRKYHFFRHKPLAPVSESNHQFEPESPQSPPQKAVFHVQGIHCASCVVRIERKLKQIEGVQDVQVDLATGKAELICICVPPVEQLDQAVHTDGYAVLLWEDHHVAATKTVQKNGARDYLEIGLIALMLVGLFLAFSHVSFIPTGIGVS